MFVLEDMGGLDLIRITPNWPEEVLMTSSRLARIGGRVHSLRGAAEG